MSSEKSTTLTLRYGLLTVSAATLSIALALGNASLVRAQSDDSSDQPQPSYAVVPDVTPSSDQADAASQAQAESDAADAAIESATEERNQLESDGASQDQIDAANQALAEARAQKQAAFNAAQAAGQPQGDAQGDAQDAGQNQ